jgi:hypothetical protein
MLTAASCVAASLLSRSAAAVALSLLSFASLLSLASITYESNTHSLENTSMVNVASSARTAIKKCGH